MTDDPLAAAKEQAGRFAASFVEDGMVVGLGTGSTVRWTIVALGERNARVTCAATSNRTEELARFSGLRVVPPDALGRVDLAIDGADEVDSALNLVKGGGGAHTREKVVAYMADRFVVVVDGTKLVDRLGRFGVPLEVLRFAPGVVADSVRELGAIEVTRMPGRTDNGNPLLRAWFGEIHDPDALAARLDRVPGLVEHGLFLRDCVERVVVAGGDGAVRELHQPRA